MMKKVSEILLVMFVAVLACGLSGCDDNDDPKDKNETEAVISQESFTKDVEGKIWQLSDNTSVKYYNPQGVVYPADETVSVGNGVKKGYYFDAGSFTEFTFISFGPVPDESMRKYRKTYQYALNEKTGEVTYSDNTGEPELLLFTIESVQDNSLTVRMPYDGIDQGGYMICTLSPVSDAASWWKEYTSADK